ncbi:oxygenase MpaB family protein [uncultured Gordonia sp.]|uniref:oxygenase MpaB family protein n=1 Tax=uncultured Gordonia sp. TaxID=198437 RepID=UPI002585729D|nr:oxygenase MpaB family protein [uncultured Gordonia sp.]
MVSATTTRTAPVGRRHPTTMLDLITVEGLTSGVANIIMQLSLPPVGAGVNESRVVSGSPRRYPMKRTRTTGTYLAVALLGTEDEKNQLRAEVAQMHKPVVSTPDSPVRYSGNSPDLQLWVAACLFRFYLDQYTILYGDLTTAELDVLVRAGEPLATGVNVRPASWPQTWAEFTQYWEGMQAHLSISAEVKRDFETLSNMEFVLEAWGPLGRPFPLLLGKHYQFMTRANLPPRFRELMGWDWTDRDQRNFDRALARMRVLDRVGGRQLALGLLWSYMIDFRLRRRLGIPVLGTLRVTQIPIRDGGGVRRLARRWWRQVQ